MKYFIVGYMASGKSTFGKELAKDKGLPFLDLDESIEAREGRSISEIFAKEGEVYFREREREILHEICNERDEFVLAAGGGNGNVPTGLYWRSVPMMSWNFLSGNIWHPGFPFI